MVAIAQKCNNFLSFGCKERFLIMPTIIEMNNIVKVFPPNVVALDDVSVDFNEGEIHALVGENGAGKSTLMKALYGMHHPNQGEILFGQQPIKIENPGEAINRGIGMVHQEIMLVPEYSVWQNVILGVEPTKSFGRIDKKKARAEVQKRIEEYQFNLDPDAFVKDISVAAQQKVEILKLLYRNVSILILDEPTSVLTPQEIPQLFNELRRLRNNGHTILFISHHLDEVMELSDRITVLRRGKKIGTVKASETNKTELAQMMVGREVLFSTLSDEHEKGEVVFELKNWSFTDAEGLQRLQNINIEVRAGELVGIAGVEGNGQHELVNSIMGLIQPTQGNLTVSKKELTNSQIIDRRKSISFVSQDRKNMGASVNSSIKENILMTHHRLNPLYSKMKGFVINEKTSASLAEEVRDQFAVHMDTSEAPFKSLSGGNQQKVILGRELLLDAPFLLLDQPTRGLDVGSIEYVHKQILDMRAKGRAILMLSADLEELFRLSDRILVLNRGEIVANLKTEKTSISEVGYLMLEGKHNEKELS